MEDKIVYFLGAGATKDVCENAPLNNDLLQKALKDFSNSKESNDLEDFIKNVFKKRKNPKKDNQIWNLLDYVIQEGKSASFKYNIEKIVKIRNSLLNLIIKEFNKSLENVDLETYRKFVLKIKESNSTIISTNYDIIIDNALAGMSCFDYGAKVRHSVYIQPQSQRVIDPRNEEVVLQGFNRPFLAREANLNNGMIKLLKIHGSLNWLYCRKCDEVDLTIKEKGAKDLLSGVGVTCLNNHCTNKYEPLLITPTMFKNYENKFLKEIWSWAEKKLIECKNLVFVGYSLKEEDVQIRCLLMKALLNKEKSYQNLTIVDMDPEKEKDKNKIKRKQEELKNLKEK